MPRSPRNQFLDADQPALAGAIIRGLDCAMLRDKLHRLPDGTIKPATEGLRERLAELQSPVDFQAQWTGDLEACLGSSGKADPAWEAKNIELKGSLEVMR